MIQGMACHLSPEMYNTVLVACTDGFVLNLS